MSGIINHAYIFFKLKMRGHKVRFNEAGDGEVDENYWVQAAAEQAAGRIGDEGDEGGQLPSER